jgi:hypothetical protein
MRVWFLVLLLGCGDKAGDDTAADTASDTEADADTDADSDCPQTHARVGHVAELETHHHDTAGTATILDDCTIQVTGFTYDGTGLDVRFYGALGSDFDSGFALTEDLIRDGGYSDETLTITIPEGHTVDEVDSLSLWCVDVSRSFGDGVFVAP